MGAFRSITSLIPPLYFVRSGYIGINTDYLRTAGINGYTWEELAAIMHSSGEIAPSAYSFRFDGIEAFPMNGPNNRFAGFSLRCLDNGGENSTIDYLDRPTEEFC